MRWIIVWRDLMVELEDQPDAWGLGILPPLTVTAPILLLLASISATANRIAFTVPEGARGAMRVRWPWWRTFLLSLGDWIVLVPFFMATAWVVKSAPLERGRWRSSLARHLLALVVLLPCEMLLRQLSFMGVTTSVAGWAETQELVSQLSLRRFAAQSYQLLIIYIAMAALLYALKFRRHQREKEHQALMLQHQLAQTQLQMLRMQLNPHFLFNTLNALGSLMRKDVETADEMLLALTEFLRSTLNEHGTLVASLERELALTERYLQIERIRFPGRLQVEVLVDPRTLSLSVPSFLLQPLVENSIRHGIAPRASGGHIWIRAALEPGLLNLSVEDDGLGADTPTRRTSGQGLGLSNTRERLRQHHGPRATMEAGPLPGGGFRVEIRIPLLPELSESHP